MDRRINKIVRVKKKPKAEGSKRLERMKICLDCPELSEKWHQCRVCKCFMEVKTGIASASCPLGKW